jgi:hypothetical protein
MRTSFYPFILPWLAALTLASAADFPTDPLGWPAETQTQKPWTRWWWLGSAVDKPNLTRELEEFARNGIGGVEICPIYGAKGAEDRFIDFLSPEWMEMLAHTTREAKRLGLGVDMTTGTGWPFGGPQVNSENASNGLRIIRHQTAGGSEMRLSLPEGKLHSLRAFPETGGAIDLAPMVKGGKLEWLAPAGNWEIIGLSSQSPIQKVKRAAPGGEGHVLDPFSKAAMDHYLTAFDQAFAGFSAPMPRAQFHDSFEYYGADWTPGFSEAFLTSRGYDLRDQLRAFAGIGDADTVLRVGSDYRETLNELHLAYLRRWHDWTKTQGGVTRNQAHGSPGNLLDHYAVSEIPETEIFRHVDENQIPMLRIAASATHANGNTLVSAETFTWLDEHFQVTPEKLKDAADFVFLGGVNHVFFHGIPYSPDDAKWPGWLFYASTHMGKNGGLWRDLSAFTGYLERCQSILQDGKPDSDVLLYYPIHDLWHHKQDKLPLFTVHNQNEWLWPTTFYQTSMDLWNHGIAFDYASDDMLAKATVRNGRIQLGHNAFRALVLPGVKRMQPETLKRILELQAQGANVIVQDGWPQEVPGFHQQAERRDALLAHGKAGAGVISCEGSTILPLSKLNCRQEKMTDFGLRFVRRSHAEGHHYFIVNRGKETFDRELPLATPFKSAVVFDPWSPSHRGVVSSNAFSLRLEPGQSIILRTFTDRVVKGGPWIKPPANPASIAIEGPWKIEFIEGGPLLPALADSIQPGSWTTLPGAADFSGTARYTTTFNLTQPLPASCRLDLGRVASTARVSLNGQALGISWCAPHVIEISRALKAGENLLEIEVTNLAANRIADLDRRKVPWKQFHEINFVNIDYQLFDAAGWKPLDSGLLGPVRLLVPARN